MEKLYIRSVSDFINEVFKKIEKFQLNDRKLVWFRGESSEDYKLVPGLYRKLVDNGFVSSRIDIPDRVFQIEQNIDSFFHKKSSIFLSKKGIENTNWNRYFLKQHYSNKTRLLDWTESALLALFFAVRDDSNLKKAGRVWILEPLELNNYSISKLVGNDAGKRNYRGILTCGKLKKKKLLVDENGAVNSSQLLTKYYRMDFKTDEIAYPIAINPPHLDDRMAAQQACFTIFGNMINSSEFESSENKFIESVYIDPVKKLDILEELRILGITEYSIYPDLDGLGKSITTFLSKDIYKMQSDNDFSNVISLFQKSPVD